MMTHFPATQRKRVVIVGAGFGGVAEASGLAYLPVDVTLVDQHDYHTFQPLVYQVATALLNAEDVGREVARPVPAPGQPHRPPGNGHPP
jgi:NADH dehydrogenase